MLSQSEADYLINMDKELNESVIIPMQGNKASYNAMSLSGREKFLLDINRTGVIKLTRCFFQERYQSNDILVRLDLDKSKPHKNPDDKIIIGPHIHIYREGYGISYAYLLSDLVGYHFTDIDNLLQTIVEFCEYCHIETHGNIQGSLL
ncbi:MAG: hypothetical protein FWH40_09660 [Coriobacteriia bacterium]|nr:hypothetical protein [Coriobacteriia bacterium]